jgi:hypothetical protein
MRVYVIDRISYIIVRGYLCNIVMKYHAPPEEKTDDMKDSFYKELPQAQ